MATAEKRPPIKVLNSRSLKQHIFSSLESCTTLKRLTEIHAKIIINGFSQKRFLLAKLLSFCCASSTVASQNLVYAYKAFEQIENPSMVVCNQMIRGFSHSDTPQKSILLFHRMQETEAQPDGFTYSFLLKACTRSSLLKEGEQFHGKIVQSGFDSDLFVQTNLVNMYSTVGGKALGRARKVFDEMPERSVVSWNAMLAGYLRSGDADGARRLFDEMPERNVVSWTTMIAGCAQTGRCKQAVDLFRQMRRSGVQVDQVTMVAALSACAELGNLDLGQWIHAYIENPFAGFREQRLVSLNNALIHMYAKCGVVEEAHKVFEAMTERSLVSWTTMITGFAMHGRGKEALDIFQRMQRVPLIRPDEITFIGVLCACSHVGWVDEGLHYFDCMIRVYQIRPRIEHYGCMVDLLSRAGHLSEAKELIETMPMEPNDIVWAALLTGCRIHKEVELASQVAGRLLELKPDDPAGYLVLLSNVYAVAKRWDDVGRVREMMKTMGVRKPPGCSWIQVGEVVHEFLMGDRTHRHSAAIYEMVGEIERRAKLDGHVPDVSQVLVDVDEEEREGFLYLHSEKLAMAFGLIAIPDGKMPIRIVKNLRICCDCHSTAKIVSKIFNRKISIRDRNRFHHFMEGICSCNDYW